MKRNAALRQNEVTEEHVSNEGQDKTPEERLSEMEISNIPKKELRCWTGYRQSNNKGGMDAQYEKLDVLNKKSKKI